jgi:hypothetical protein
MRNLSMTEQLGEKCMVTAEDLVGCKGLTIILREGHIAHTWLPKRVHHNLRRGHWFPPSGLHSQNSFMSLLIHYKSLQGLHRTLLLKT